MRIGLASYRCENRNIAFNMKQIELAMKRSDGKVDLLCFGEAFLQGFDALCWDYEADKTISNRTWVDIYSFEKNKSGYITKAKAVYSGPYLYLNRRFSK